MVSSLSVAQAVDHVARADLVLQLLGIIAVAGIFHRVEVIEVAEELVEAVDRGQKLVPVAQVILAELPGGITHCLESCGDRRRFGRHADLSAGLTDGGQSGADGQFAR